MSETGGLPRRTLLPAGGSHPEPPTGLRLFQLPAFIMLPIVFGITTTMSLSWLYIGNFILGILVIGQFSSGVTICRGSIPSICVAPGKALQLTQADDW